MCEGQEKKLEWVNNKEQWDKTLEVSKENIYLWIKNQSNFKVQSISC